MLSALVLGAGARAGELAQALLATRVVGRVLTNFGLDGGVVARPEDADDLCRYAARNDVWLVVLGPAHAAAFTEALEEAGFRGALALPERALARRAALALGALPADMTLLGAAHELPDVAAEPAECVSCGACCFSVNHRYAELVPADVERLTPAEQATLVVAEGRRRFLRVVEGRCVALASQPGEHLCTIYERRPEVCRAFERGSSGCTFLRAAKAHAASPAKPPWWPWPLA